MQRQHRSLSAASQDLLERLQQFQATFEAADVNGSGSLDEEEFLAAFRGACVCACASKQAAVRDREPTAASLMSNIAAPNRPGCL